MIKSKRDYQIYLEADRLALQIQRKKAPFFGYKIWKFQRLLRKLEYYKNCKKSIIFKIYYLYLSMKFENLSLKLGFNIPINTIGPGLSIVHYGPITINGSTTIGENCRIHTCVNIGTKAGAGFSDMAPKIGNNVYIGPGAKIFGDIEIADGIAIGANSVVNKSFMEKGIGIAGVPAKKINDKGSEGLLIKGTTLLYSIE